MSLSYTKIQSSSGSVYPLRSEECGHILHSFSDVQELIDFSLDSALALVGAHAGSLFIWDERAKELVSRAARSPGGHHSHATDARMRLREGVTGWVADKGEPVLVTDVDRDDRFNEVKRNGRYRSLSFISLPLVAENKLIGVINITEKENFQPFTDEERQRVELFSRHIAMAYENVRIKQRLRTENQRLREKVIELNTTIKQQEGLVSMGKLASNLAHELSNPLDAIRRFVNLALEESMEDSLSKEYLLKAKKGIRRAVSVIRGLLQFSRDSVSRSGRVTELHQVILQCLDALSHHARYEKIAIDRRFTDEPVHVRDYGLALVFRNLIENAAQAMEFSGMLERGKVTVTTARQNGRVTVTVRDTGDGIPDDQLTRIFEPFFTTKNSGQGTGIGLAICQEIVERSGGVIGVSNYAENGTRGAEFTVTLPCHEKEIVHT